jgi:uncharacterized protein
MSTTTTPLPGWPYEESPFHEGERAVQQRVGVAEKVASSGRRVIRNAMPDQHREFFAQLPFVLAGSVDQEGQPWASVLFGEPGFLQSPDARHLDIRGNLPPADPLHETLHEGAALGLLGIEPHTRRRNRMNGSVEGLDGTQFTLRVNRSFGNCPKYIQARQPQLVPTAQEARVHRGGALDDRMKQLIRGADTFFIASAVAQENGTGLAHGADVSHRGGKPGFVRIDGERTLTAPDFIGNFLFNTLGNIAVNPRAGLLFIDYRGGDLLYLAADAAIIWDGPEVQAFAGAQRLLRFEVKQALLVENGLPLRWSEAALSPVLEQTGSW